VIRRKGVWSNEGGTATTTGKDQITRDDESPSTEKGVPADSTLLFKRSKNDERSGPSETGRLTAGGEKNPQEGTMCEPRPKNTSGKVVKGIKEKTVQGKRVQGWGKLKRNPRMGGVKACPEGKNLVQKQRKVRKKALFRKATKLGPREERNRWKKKGKVIMK